MTLPLRTARWLCRSIREMQRCNGRPLTGTHTGKTQINTTWNKFFGLWSAAWFYSEAPNSYIARKHSNCRHHHPVRSAESLKQQRLQIHQCNIRDEYINIGFKNRTGSVRDNMRQFRQHSAELNIEGLNSLKYPIFYCYYSCDKCFHGMLKT